MQLEVYKAQKDLVLLEVADKFQSTVSMANKPLAEKEMKRHEAITKA